MRLHTLVFTFIALLIACPLRARGNYSPDVKLLLEQLDTVLAHRADHTARAQQQMTALKASLARPGLSEAQHQLLSQQLFDMLSVSEANAALALANENIDRATGRNDLQQVALWTINKSFVLSATGLLKESYDVLSSINPSSLPRELRLQYYKQAVYLYSHMGLYLAGSSRLRKQYAAREQTGTDSLNALCEPQDPLYLWCRSLKYGNDATQRAVLINQLEQKLGHSAYDNRTDALLAYVLARLNRSAGHEDQYLAYLIRSGMADIRSANRDIASLEELAKELFRLGDLDHAYAYINFCQQNALDFNNRVRVVSIAATQNSIWQAYQARSQAQERRLGIYTALLSVLAVVLLASLYYNRRQMKRLAASQKLLEEANAVQKQQMGELEQAHKIQEEANHQLQTLNAELTEANSNLEEANLIKEEYINHIFVICSNYISKLDNYRKTINRKIKTAQYADIKQLTDSESMVQDELKEFYHNFDMVFLHLYPHFIEDFNALLQPEARFKLKSDETLNTQLRIYALVRLGINDSVKIAQFLHCSPQTVYNYRLKTRNNAMIPKDQFAYTVSRLGKIQV